MTHVIDGKALAVKLQGELAEKTARLKAETGQVPGLVVILVSMSAIKNGQLWRLDFEVKSFECQKAFPKRTCWPSLTATIRIHSGMEF